MGIFCNYFSLAEVPAMALVHVRVAERLGRPVGLIEHPAGFDFEVTSRRFLQLVPGERVIELRDNALGPREIYHSEIQLLSRALMELGGRPAAVEPQGRSRLVQRFEFEGEPPAPLAVHEQLLRLGGCEERPPSAYEPWFEFFTEAPDDQLVLLTPEPSWLQAFADLGSQELYAAVYGALESFGSKPRYGGDG